MVTTPIWYAACMWTTLDLHAGAIQAFCSVIALITTIIALILLLLTLNATRRQAQSAMDQAMAASEQLGFLRQEFALADRQYKDSIRPIIVASVVSALPDYYTIELTNDGTGPALGISGDFTETTNLLGAKSSCRVVAYKGSDQLIVHYSSLDRRRFETVVNIVSDHNCIHQYRELAN